MNSRSLFLSVLLLLNKYLSSVSSSPPDNTPHNCDLDGSCNTEIDSTVGITLPSDTYLPSFNPSPSYHPDDAFLFDTPTRSNITLNIALASDQASVQAHWEDINCGSVSATGIHGGTLGCIALGVAWLSYSMYLDHHPESTIPARSISLNHHFQVHAAWEPYENCTTKCRLLSSTPQKTWTPVANGSYHGVYHELHFMHTEAFTSHRVYQAPDENHSNLATRGGYRYKTSQLDSNFRPLYIDYYDLLQRTDHSHPTDKGPEPFIEAFDEYKSPVGLADWLGGSVEEDVAETNASTYCLTLIKGEESVSPKLLGFSQTGTDWGTPEQIEQDLKKCEAKFANHIFELGKPLFTCGWNLSSTDPSLLENPDGNQQPDIWIRSLNPRSQGKATPYRIRNFLDMAGVAVTFWSAPYVNGHNGRDLINAGGDNHVYGRASLHDCTDTGLRDDAPIEGPDAITVNAEHIFERVTMSYFFEFIQDPYMDLLDGNGRIRVPANLQPVLFNVIRDYMEVPYMLWPGLDEELLFPGEQSLFDDLAESLGSMERLDVMTNLDADLNNIKSRVWDFDALVTALKVWYNLAATPTTANTEKVLDLIRAGIIVFNYLNDDNIQKLIGKIHIRLRDAFSQFDQIFSTHGSQVATQDATNLRDLWTTFINFWVQRMVNRHRIFVDERLTILAAPWIAIRDNNPSLQDAAISKAALEKIAKLRLKFSEIRFDRSKLI